MAIRMECWSPRTKRARTSSGWSCSRRRHVPGYTMKPSPSLGAEAARMSAREQKQGYSTPCERRHSRAYSYRSVRWDWNIGSPSQSRPSQCRSSIMSWSAPATTRGLSTSSIRISMRSPRERAESHAPNMAYTLPICMRPDGVGANRPVTGPPRMKFSTMVAKRLSSSEESQYSEARQPDPPSVSFADRAGSSDRCNT